MTASFPVCVITVSDKCWQGRATDESGPAVSSLISRFFYPVTSELVPDEKLEIQESIRRCIRTHNCNLIVLTGGTGFGHRDVTPEAVEEIIEKQAPGLVAQILFSSLKITPFAALSRPVCGVLGNCIIITLPGSVKVLISFKWQGAVENLNAIINVLPHALELVSGDSGEATHASFRSVGHHDCSHGKKGGTSYFPKTVDSAHFAPLASRRSRESPFEMISYQLAKDLIIKHTPSPRPELRKVDKNLVGYVIAEHISSKENVPPFRASIVDGYAVVASDGPGIYPVVTATNAGETPSNSLSVSKGSISRISTGAALPPGANAIVMVEDTKLVSTTESSLECTVEILISQPTGSNIREIGSDIPAGEVILQPGTLASVLGSEIGLMSSVGVRECRVYRKPRVGVMSTGDEVVDDCADVLSYGQVRDSNRPSLVAAASCAGFEVVDLGIVKDDGNDLVRVIKDAYENKNVDVLITTGGVSMGEKDLLKGLVQHVLNGTIHFGRVALKPGKPTTFATIPHGKDASEEKLLFALPGNPVSAIGTSLFLSVPVTFFLFVLPTLKRMSCHPCPDPVKVNVLLSHDVILDARPEFRRAFVPDLQDRSTDVYRASPISGTPNSQRSSRMLSMTRANVLLILPARSKECTKFVAGEKVEAFIIE